MKGFTLALLQVNVLAPLARSVVDWPSQMVVFPEIAIEGEAFTTNEAVDLATQVPMPLA